MGTFDEVNVPGIPQTGTFTGLAAGTTTIVSAVAGRRASLFALAITLATAGTVQVQDTNGNALTGVMTLAVGTPLVLPLSSMPWGQSASGFGLQLVITGTSQLAAGVFVYKQGQ